MLQIWKSGLLWIYNRPSSVQELLSELTNSCSLKKYVHRAKKLLNILKTMNNFMQLASPLNWIELNVLQFAADFNLLNEFVCRQRILRNEKQGLAASNCKVTGCNSVMGSSLQYLTFPGYSRYFRRQFSFMGSPHLQPKIPDICSRKWPMLEKQVCILFCL